MIDQNTALWIFSVVALTYIIWIDARPLVQKWHRGKPRPISVSPQLAWKATPFSVGGEEYYKNTCYLLVLNESRRKVTARSVRVRTYILGDPIVATTASGNEEVNIHHGEVEGSVAKFSTD